MEKVVRVSTTIDSDRVIVIDPDGKYVACKVYESPTDGAPFTYLNFSLLDASSAFDCRDKYLRMVKATAGVFSYKIIDCIVGEVTGHDSALGCISVNLDLNAKTTDTTGKNQYVVCLACGGEMGAPEYTYNDFQIIGADSQKEAKVKYDEINHCVYFKGMCIGECLEIEGEGCSGLKEMTDAFVEHCHMIAKSDKEEKL